MPAKKINKNYEKTFIILQILEKSAIFNEIHCLFDKEQTYGTIILEENTTLLHIDKHNLQVVCDSDALSTFRANFQAKDRLHKHIIKKLSNMTNQELTQQQDNILKKYNIGLTQLEKHFKNSSDANNKIVTHSHLKEREKNMKAFENKMKVSEALDLRK